LLERQKWEAKDQWDEWDECGRIKPTGLSY